MSPTTVINAWELMDGLDDRHPAAASGYVGAGGKKVSVFQRSLTFHHHHHQLQSPPSPSKDNPKTGGAVSPGKPLWKHLSEESLLADLDPSVASALRRSSSFTNKPGKVAAAASAAKDGAAAPKTVVLYSTSLRGIRRTYEDCCSARNILRGFRVAVDERDVSMDAAFRKELQARLGGGGKGRPAALPQVFVGERCVGGAEEVRQLHESGELGKLLEGVPRQDPRFVCGVCGGVRFVVCCVCSGSRKVFDEEDGQLRRCPDCNDNGLVRCPDCC